MAWIRYFPFDLLYNFKTFNLNTGIITISHNRPSVLRLWCCQIKRLREELETYIPAVVVSDEADESICNEYHVFHITQQNNPVTEKFNRAFKYMQSQGINAVMTLGSDDIISTEYVRKTLAELNNGADYVGTRVFYFYCGQGLDRGKMVKLDSPQTKGIGRTVSKAILDQCDWRLWDKPKNWGMDAIATKNIVKYAKKKAIIEDIIVDVKTRVNLNSFKIWGRRLPQVPPEIFYNILSEEELLILKTL